MKHLTYRKNGIVYLPIKSWKTDNNTEVAIYKGGRGESPELDIIIKYREKGKRLRTPSHTHWIYDVLLKSVFGKDKLLSFIDDMIKIYDNTIPFKNEKDRDDYELKYPSVMSSKHLSLQGCGGYSVETLTTFIELFSLCEKQTTGAFMFLKLLNLIKEYCEGKKDSYQIIGISKRV
jgi:hypothetical protein